MPSSTPQILNEFVTEILKLNPTSILDIGIGFGKYGFLCREYLETWKGNNYPNQWKVKIDGIEIWKEYVDNFTWLYTIYNRIYNCPAIDCIYKLAQYDVIIAGDVLEHMTKDEGLDVLDRCKFLAKKAIIVSIPLGKEWLNNKVFDNPYEQHQAVWTLDDIRGFDIIKIWQVGNRKGALAIWRNK